jgi:hypothetical protein
MNQAALDELKNLALFIEADREHHVIAQQGRRIWVMPDRPPLVHQVVFL